jgi:hypothetical protein
MEPEPLIPVLDLEADALAAAARAHARLGPLFAPEESGAPVRALRAAYLRLLKVTADYVAFTTAMLRAAGAALRGGDAEDRAWSERFLAYADDETDPEGRYGHHVWALNDMKALGAGATLLEAPLHPRVAAYGRYFVDEAAQHPYAILGAKGVLEHLSVRISDELVRGVRVSGLEYADDAATFYAHHGVLDIEHVRAGDANLERLTRPQQRDQVLVGAYVTGGSYRAFLGFCV